MHHHSVEPGNAYHEPSSSRTLICMPNGTLILRPGHSKAAYLSGLTLVVPPLEDVVTIRTPELFAGHTLEFPATINVSHGPVAAPQFPGAPAMPHQQSAGALAAQDSISLQDLQAPKLRAGEVPDSAHGGGMADGGSLRRLLTPKKEPRAASDDAELLLDFAQRAATFSAVVSDTGEASQGPAERAQEGLPSLKTGAEETLPGEIRTAFADVLIRRLQQAAATQGSPGTGASPELPFLVGQPQQVPAMSEASSELTPEELQSTLRRNTPQLAGSWPHASASPATETFQGLGLSIVRGSGRGTLPALASQAPPSDNMARGDQPQAENWRVLNAAGASSATAPSYSPAAAASKRGAQGPAEQPQPAKAVRLSQGPSGGSRDRLPPLPEPTAMLPGGLFAGTAESAGTRNAELVNAIRAAAARSPEGLQVVLQLLLAKQAELASAGGHTAGVSLGWQGTAAQPIEQAVPNPGMPGTSVGPGSLAATHDSGMLQHVLRQRLMQAVSQQSSKHSISQDQRLLLQAFIQAQQQQAAQQLQLSPLLLPQQGQQPPPHHVPLQHSWPRQQPWQEQQYKPTLPAQGSGEGMQQRHSAQGRAGSLEAEQKPVQGLDADDRGTAAAAPAAAAVARAPARLEGEPSQSGDAGTSAAPATLQALLASALHQVQARLVAQQPGEPSSNTPPGHQSNADQKAWSQHLQSKDIGRGQTAMEHTAERPRGEIASHADAGENLSAAPVQSVDVLGVRDIEDAQNLAGGDSGGPIQRPAETILEQHSQADPGLHGANAATAAEAGKWALGGLESASNGGAAGGRHRAEAAGASQRVEAADESHRAEAACANQGAEAFRSNAER